MHGLNAAGEIVHTEVTPMPPTWPAPADTLGGFFSFSGIGGSSEGFVVRRNAFGGQGTTWEYRSAPHVAPQYYPFNRAQARDGTLYVVEQSRDALPLGGWGGIAFVVVLDGATGDVRARVPLPATSYCYGQTPSSNGVERDLVPLVHPILVGRDGAAYVSVATQVQGCVFNDISGPASRARNELFMVRIDPTGSSQTMSIRHWTAFYCTNCENPGQVIYYAGAPVPDGQGNVLSTGLVETWNPATGFSTFDTVTYRYGPSGTGETSFDAHTTAAGRDGVYELSGGQLVARAPLNGATRWSVPTSDYEQVLQVLSDGGVTLYDPAVGQTSTIDGTGARQPAEQLPLSGPAFRTDVGELVGSTFTPDWITYLGVAKVVTSDTTDYTVYPSPAGQNAEEIRGRFGIYVKGHTAVHELGVDIGPFRHASIRVTPRDQPYWAPILSTFETTNKGITSPGTLPDSYGNYFFTLGAGPIGSDTNAAKCILNLPSGPLTADRNRVTDRDAHADNLKMVLDNDLEPEFQLVSRLLDQANYYRDNHNTGPSTLTYKCFPPASEIDFFNSNSYVSGMLIMAGLPLPTFGGWRYPGWTKPVPSTYFGLFP